MTGRYSIDPFDCSSCLEKTVPVDGLPTAGVCLDGDDSGNPDKTSFQPGIVTVRCGALDTWVTGVDDGWYDPGEDLPDAAFVWTQAVNGTLDGAHSWNSAGLVSNTVTRESAGIYRVDFPRQGGPAGNFQVNALNSPLLRSQSVPRVTPPLVAGESYSGK